MDLALTRFESGDGILAQVDAKKLLEPLNLICSLGLRNFRYFISRVGGAEELENRLGDVTVGGIPAIVLSKGLVKNKIHSGGITQDVVKKLLGDKRTSGELDSPETFRTIKLTLRELGFHSGANDGDIYERSRSLGLELCPRTTGIVMRLNDLDQPKGDSYYIASDPLYASDTYVPQLSNVEYNEVGLSFYTKWVGNQPDGLWSSNDTFVFRIPERRAVNNKNIK
jgi:hypothetical protein